MRTDAPYGIYVPGKGNTRSPKIVFVGESPGYAEVKELEPFVGPTGKFFNMMLREAGIERAECWMTYVCKYFVSPNSQKKNLNFTTRAKIDGIDLTVQVNELLTELNQLNANVIVPLGKTALWALTGKDDIKAYRGSILSGLGWKLIPTYGPGNILHQDGDVKGFYNRAVSVLDLRRAKKQSEFREIKLPVRDIRWTNSSEELANRLSRFPKRVAVDTEQKNGVSACIGFAPSAKEAITVPFFDQKISTREQVLIWSQTSNFLSRAEVIGQNFGYDRNKIRPYGFTIGRLVADTLLKAFAVNPELPKSQEFLASIYTEEPHYKNEEMYESTFENLMLGCSRDCAVSYEINDGLDRDLDEMGLRPYYDNFILPLHDLYFFREDRTAIEQMGFLVNESIRESMIRKYIEWDEKIRYNLFELTGQYVNTSSPQQVAKILYEDLGIPRREGTGEEVLTTLLGNGVKNPSHRLVVNQILEDRRVKKTLSSYLYSPPDHDGRMRTSYYICLETGRSATQQQEPPTREKVEFRDDDGKLKRCSLGMAFQTITKHGDIGNDIRTMLVADPGHILLQVDGSQAEARVIFLLAEDYEALELIDKIDYHALTASWFVGGSWEDWSKKRWGYEHPNRFLGKTIRHAGHLGASKRRASLEANTQARKYKIDISVSEAEAGRGLDIFHKKQPKIRGVFQAGIIKAIDKNRRLAAPVPYGVDAKVGGTRIFFERGGDELYRQAFSYIPQRTVSEMVKGAAMRSRKRADYIHFIVEAHDGLVAQVPEEKKYEAAAILKEEMERPIDFSTCTLPRGTLVIPCEIEGGYDYKNLKDFKFKG